MYRFNRSMRAFTIYTHLNGAKSETHSRIAMQLSDDETIKYHARVSHRAQSDIPSTPLGIE